MGTSRRPSSSRYLGAGLLAFVGLGEALVRGVLAHHELHDRLDALPRTTVAGVVAIGVSSPEGLTVYYDDPSADGGFIVQADDTNRLPVSHVDLTVTALSGDHNAIEHDETDLRFDAGLVTSTIGAVVLFVGTRLVALPVFVVVAVLRSRTSAADAPDRTHVHACPGWWPLDPLTRNTRPGS